jgi:flagellar biosynthesis GTPase FlhF
MKKTAVIGFLALAALTGCGNSAQVATEPQANNTNASSQQQRNADSLVTSSHSSDKTQSANNPAAQQQQPNGAPRTQTESPMAKPIDVSEMTAAIEKAEKDYKAKATDTKAKERLAEAYFARAFALTEAAQYRAALGDFRKGLKLNADHKDARAMHDRIISIFSSIKREPPKEGEEPPPMPFNKQGS